MKGADSRKARCDQEEVRRLGARRLLGKESTMSPTCLLGLLLGQLGCLGLLSTQGGHGNDGPRKESARHWMDCGSNSHGHFQDEKTSKYSEARLLK